MGGGQAHKGPNCTHFAPGFCKCVCIYMCVCVLQNVYFCAHYSEYVCVRVSVRFLIWPHESDRAEDIFSPDAFAPRTLSGVPVKSRWATTVGTYISPQGKAIGPTDETHQSSSQPGLTCPSVLFMVAYAWRKNAYGRGALSSPVGTCVHSQRWRAFKDCSAQLVQFTRLAGGCDLISLHIVSLVCMQLYN